MLPTPFSNDRILFARRACAAARIIATIALGLLLSPAARAQTVQPGLDLFVTPAPPPPSLITGTSIDFSATPIPAGTFCPGSPAFTGTVYFKGEPYNSIDLRWRTTDTVVGRLAAAALTGPGSEDTIPIEILALSLVMIYSATRNQQAATSLGGDYYLKRQAIYVAVGLVAMAIDHAAALDVRSAGLRLTAIAFALVFVVPAPAASSTTEVPPFFRSWAEQGIADDEVILFAPWFTNGAGADPMLWAAFAEARPRMYEGYVYVPDAEGRPRYGPAAGGLARLMIEVQDHGVLPDLTAEDRAAAARELTDAGVSVVIVGPTRYRQEMLALFTDLFHQPPVEKDGVQLWPDVQLLLRRLAAVSG